MNTLPDNTIIKKLEENLNKYRKGIEWLNGDIPTPKVGEAITHKQMLDFLIEALIQERKDTLNEISANVGFLRQWLNEDRITDPRKMVTNAEIVTWLHSELSVIKLQRQRIKKTIEL